MQRKIIMKTLYPLLKKTLNHTEAYSSGIMINLDEGVTNLTYINGFRFA